MTYQNVLPVHYNLPHDEFRPYQRETIQKITSSDKKIIVLQAPTGSGKTAYAASLGAGNNSVTSLVLTKSLQDQYERLYNFISMKGLSNYACEFIPTNMADMCLFLDEMSSCPVSTNCSYLLKRIEFIQSLKRVTNYVYFLMSSVFDNSETKYLVCDEAHKLPNIMRDFVSLSMTVNDKTKLQQGTGLQLNHWPVLDNKMPMILKLSLYADWVQESKNSVITLAKILKGRAKSERTPVYNKLIMRLENFATRFDFVLAGINTEPQNWFGASTSEEINIVPLLPSNQFNDLFVKNRKYKIVLMSATIGKIDTYADYLSLNKEDYQFINIPNTRKPQERPVYLLDCPSMGYKATTKDYERQADSIAKAILGVDWNWSGIIHVNSRNKQYNLCQRLAKRGLQNRIFAIDGYGTDGKLANWLLRKKKVPNSIGITYSFTEGVDLGNDKINISADIPYILLDEVGMARLKASPKFYAYSAAIDLEQRLGRTRRGRDEDYDVSGEKRGLVAIADGNYNRVKSYLSDDFREAVIKL